MTDTDTAPPLASAILVDLAIRDRPTVMIYRDGALHPAGRRTLADDHVEPSGMCPHGQASTQPCDSCDARFAVKARDVSLYIGGVRITAVRDIEVDDLADGRRRIRFGLNTKRASNFHSPRGGVNLGELDFTTAEVRVNHPETGATVLTYGIAPADFSARIGCPVELVGHPVQ